jgi:hypothetical protein
MDFVVRARPNYYGEIFKEEWEISYNSRNIKVIEPGRFNRRFEPMFYAALKGNDHKGGNLPTASMESCKELLDPTNTNTTQMLTFGKWKVKEMFRVINLTYHEPTMRNNPQARNFLNLYFAEVEKELPKSTVDQIRKFIIFLSTITSTKDNNHSHYFISNAFWVTVREYYENFDGTKMYGIIYPSLMTEHNGINLVLTPEAVDTFLELTNVMMYTYERRKANMKEYWGYPVTNLAEVKDHRYSLLFTPPGL